MSADRSTAASQLRLPRRAVLAGGAALAACGRNTPSEAQAAPPSPSPRALPRTSPPPALRSLSALPVGVCFNLDFEADPGYAELVTRQFSQITPEWNFQMPTLLKADGSYEWAFADRIVAFADAAQQRIHGTSLIWYAVEPVPVFPALEGQPQAFLNAYRSYIHTVAGRFRGRVSGWDVINESVAEQGDGLRDCRWSRNLGGTDAYIARAFEAAKEADPGAVLFINDYNLAAIPKKRFTLMRLIDRLRAQGVPIGGVGAQTHLDTTVKPGAVATAIRDLGSLGLPVHISEFDVKFGRANETRYSAADRDRIVADYTAEAAGAFRALPWRQQYAFTVWGARDKDSMLNRAQWKGDGTDTPLLFRNDGEPKLAFWALADRLAAGSV